MELLETMIQNDKLVRDRIPEILRAQGKRCDVRTLADDEFAQRVEEKLAEEIAEYRESGEIEELADIVKLIEAIAEQRGVEWDQFERLRLQKREQRGGFTRRLLVCRVDE